jgi:hypothetical protein
MPFHFLLHRLHICITNINHTNLAYEKDNNDAACNISFYNKQIYWHKRHPLLARQIKQFPAAANSCNAVCK